MNRRLAAALVGAIALLTTGCSQINAYAPVSGGPKATVEIAIGDVLANRQIPVLVRPECVLNADTFTCEGSTISGDPIVGTATATRPFILTLVVGETTIFDGDAQTAIDDAMRVEP